MTRKVEKLFCKFGLYDARFPCKNPEEDWMKEEDEDNQVGQKYY